MYVPSSPSLYFKIQTLFAVEYLNPFWHTLSLYAQHCVLGFSSQFREEEEMEKTLQYKYTFLLNFTRQKSGKYVKTQRKTKSLKIPASEIIIL